MHVHVVQAEELYGEWREVIRKRLLVPLSMEDHLRLPEGDYIYGDFKSMDQKRLFLFTAASL